jgi:hypothetical protein
MFASTKPAATLLTVNYTADDAPTLRRFHASPAYFRGVRGPQGSGKSTACVIEILLRAMAQAPDAQGVRRTAFAVVRATYPELRSTTIPTWRQWVPDNIAPIVYGSPITCRLGMALPDGSMMDMLVYFVSLESEDDMRKALGLELTGCWFNEARELPLAIVTGVLARTGRYPAKAVAKLTWAGGIADTNPPDDSHWWYRLAELGEWRVKGAAEGFVGEWAFFAQPGALLRRTDPATGQTVGYRTNPTAENVLHQQLGYNYWYNMLAGRDPDWIRAMVCGEYSSVFSGKPVYHEVWREATHMATEQLAIYRELPLRLGFDFGNTPACCAAQLSPGGQLRILREWTCMRGGIREFATEQVLPGIKNDMDLAGLPLIVHCDPAGAAPTQVTITETPIGELVRLGFPAQPTGTNDYLMRREAVLYYLTRTVDGRPGLIVDPRCTTLRKAMNGGYHYARRRSADGSDRLADSPEKNDYSHLAEAMQYLCQGAREIHRSDGTTVSDTTLPPPAPSKAAWGAYV